MKANPEYPACTFGNFTIEKSAGGGLFLERIVTAGVPFLQLFINCIEIKKLKT